MCRKNILCVTWQTQSFQYFENFYSIPLYDFFKRILVAINLNYFIFFWIILWSLCNWTILQFFFWVCKNAYFLGFYLFILLVIYPVYLFYVWMIYVKCTYLYISTAKECIFKISSVLMWDIVLWSAIGPDHIRFTRIFSLRQCNCQLVKHIKHFFLIY